MAPEKEDRRVRRTKERLRQALTQLLLEKDIHDITVRELTDLADVNRGTFYTHYKDIYDLLEQTENALFSELEECIPSGETAERRLEEGELTQVLNGWLASLSQSDRVLFLRRYWNGEPL